MLGMRLALGCSGFGITFLSPSLTSSKACSLKPLILLWHRLTLFEDAISKVGSLLKPITGLIGDLTGALKSMCFAHAAPAAEEFNKQLTAGIENSNALTQKLDPLKQGLLGVAGGACSTSGVSGSASLGQQQNMTQQELILETKNLTAAITKLNGSAQRGGSANQSVAVALQRRF